jgi:hypothetical protein
VPQQHESTSEPAFGQGAGRLNFGVAFEETGMPSAPTTAFGTAGMQATACVQSKLPKVGAEM